MGLNEYSKLSLFQKESKMVLSVIVLNHQNCLKFMLLKTLVPKVPSLKNAASFQLCCGSFLGENEHLLILTYWGHIISHSGVNYALPEN